MWQYSRGNWYWAVLIVVYGANARQMAVPELSVIPTDQADSIWRSVRDGMIHVAHQVYCLTNFMWKWLFCVYSLNASNKMLTSPSKNALFWQLIYFNSLRIWCKWCATVNIVHWCPVIHNFVSIIVSSTYHVWLDLMQFYRNGPWVTLYHNNSYNVYVCLSDKVKQGCLSHVSEGTLLHLQCHHLKCRFIQ